MIFNMSHCEVWNTFQCIGGVRQAILTQIISLTATEQTGEMILEGTVALADGAASYIKERTVIRPVGAFGSYDEWVVTRIKRSANSRTLTFQAGPAYLMLATQAMISQLNDGVRLFNFEIANVLPTDIITGYIQVALSTWGMPGVWSLNSLDDNSPVTIQCDWDTPLSLLRKLEAATGQEFTHQLHGTTGYYINLNKPLAYVPGGANVLDVRYGKNLLTHEQDRDTTQQANWIFPRGADMGGYRATMGGALWKVVAVPGPGGVDVYLADPAGGDAPFLCTDQLTGYYLVDVNRGLHLVSGTYAGATQAVALAGGNSAFAVGDLVWFVNDTTPTDITWLRSIPDINTYGALMAVLDVPDVPNTVNRGMNAGFTDGGTGWGGSTAAGTMDYVTVRPGATASLRTVPAASVNQHFTSPASKVGVTTVVPYLCGFMSLWVVSGKVRVEMIVDGTHTIPLPPTYATTDVTGQWVDLGVENIDIVALVGVGVHTVQMRAVAHDGAADFYVGGYQITEGAGQKPYVNGSGATQLWQAANERLRLYGTPVISETIAIIDLFRYDGKTIQDPKWIESKIFRGLPIRITDARMGPAYGTRVVGQMRDYIVPANTTITLSNKPEDLFGVLGKPAKIPKRSGLNAGKIGASVIRSAYVEWSKSDNMMYVYVSADGSMCKSVVIEASTSPAITSPAVATSNVPADEHIKQNFGPVTSFLQGRSWYFRATPYSEVAGGGVAGNPVYFELAVPFAFSFTAAATENMAAGTGTLTLTVQDPGLVIDQTLRIEFYVSVNGVRTLTAPTTAPGSGTTGVFTSTGLLDDKHNLKIEPLIHYADGTSAILGAWTFDVDQTANVVNVAVADNGAGTATVTAQFDTDTVVGSTGARYNIDAGSWVTLPVNAVLVGQFNVTQSSSAKRVVEIQGKDATGSYGPSVYAEVDVYVTPVIGPTLTVTPTPGNPNYTITWSGTGVITMSADGGSYGTPTASPFNVARDAVNDKTITFKAVGGGQTVTDTVVIPSLEHDTVTPNLDVVPGTPTSSQIPFTVNFSNPSGGTAPTGQVTCTFCSMIIGGTTYPSGSAIGITSGTVVTAVRPVGTQPEQATLTFQAAIAGGGFEEISRTIANTFAPGPTLVVTPVPGTAQYTINWSGTGTITYAVDGGSFGTPPTSGFTVSRSSGGVDHTIIFKAVADGQTVTDSVTVPSLESDTITPDLDVVAGTPSSSQVPFTVNAANPSGGSAPTITVKCTFCSMIIGGTTYTTGSTITITSGTVVTAVRPPVTQPEQATLTFKASQFGGGVEVISRTIASVYSSGPSLTVTPSITGTTFSISWTATGTVTYSIDGSAFSTPGGTPITGSRDANDHTYTFKSTLDNQTLTDAVTIPSLEKGFDTPDLDVAAGTPTSSQVPFTVTFSNPGTGSAPTGTVKCTFCSMVIGGTTYTSGTTVTIASGTVVTALRPGSTQPEQATLLFKAVISGGGSEEISRTITSTFGAGPSLDINVVPNGGGTNIDYIYWTGSGTITVNIDNAGYGTPASSPIAVTRNTVDHVYTFKAVADGQTATQPVRISKLISGGSSAGTGHFTAASRGTGNTSTDQIPISWTWSGSSGGYFQVLMREDFGSWVAPASPTNTGSGTYNVNINSSYDLNGGISPQVYTEFRIQALDATNVLMDSIDITGAYDGHT